MKNDDQTRERESVSRAQNRIQESILRLSRVRLRRDVTLEWPVWPSQGDAEGKQDRAAPWIYAKIMFQGLVIEAKGFVPRIWVV